jgi:hypothetical protein
MNESILQGRPPCPDDTSTTTDDALHEIQTHRKDVHGGARAGFSVATAYRIEQNPHLPSSKKAPRERRHSHLLAEIFEAKIVPLQQSGPCFVWGDASRHLQDTIRPTRPLKLRPQIHPGHAHNAKSHSQVSLLATWL